MVEFAMANPGWTVCIVLIVCYAITRPFRYIYMGYRRKLRSHDIQTHGWPTTPNMDADGDIIHPNKETDQ
jgi:hypothetical protein